MATPKKVRKKKPAGVKYIWTLILPDNGKEIIIGAFDTEGKARGHAKRHFNPDYLSVCTYPIQRRPARPNDVTRTGEPYVE